MTEFEIKNARRQIFQKIAYTLESINSPLEEKPFLYLANACLMHAADLVTEDAAARRQVRGQILSQYESDIVKNSRFEGPGYYNWRDGTIPGIIISHIRDLAYLESYAGDLTSNILANERIKTRLEMSKFIDVSQIPMSVILTQLPKILNELVTIQSKSGTLGNKEHHPGLSEGKV